MPLNPCTPLAVLHFERLLINRFTVINGFYSRRLFFFFVAHLQLVYSVFCVYVFMCHMLYICLLTSTLVQQQQFKQLWFA